MAAPFVVGRHRVPGNRLGQILVTRQVAVPASDHHLMQIAGLVERLQRCRRRRQEPERRGDLDLGDPYSGSCQPRQRSGGRLEFDRLMAAVIADADQVTQVGRQSERGKEVADLVGGFQQASGFGLQGEDDLRSPVPAQRLQMAEHGDELLSDSGQILVAEVALEADRNRRDRPGHALRQPSGEQVGQANGIGRTFRTPPVWQVDLFLDALAMEGSVGEAVDRRDKTVVLAQPVGEAPVFPGRQFDCRSLRKPQADRKRLFR